MALNVTYRQLHLTNAITYQGYCTRLGKFLRSSVDSMMKEQTVMCLQNFNKVIFLFLYSTVCYFRQTFQM